MQWRQLQQYDVVEETCLLPLAHHYVASALRAQAFVSAATTATGASAKAPYVCFTPCW